MTGTSTYTGGTKVSAGTLATDATATLGTGDVVVLGSLTLGNAASIADSAALRFFDTAGITLDAAGGSETVAGLYDLTTGTALTTPGTYSMADLNRTFGDDVFSAQAGESLTIVAVPEPTGLTLLAAAAVGPLALRRRRRAAGREE